MSQEIYREIILEHYKSPKNRGTAKGANVKKVGANLLCGDSFEISARVEGGKIVDVKFDGGGCAISTACADILCEIAKGKSKGQILKMNADEVFKRIGFVPSAARQKCALLGLETLKKAVK